MLSAVNGYALSSLGITEEEGGKSMLMVPLKSGKAIIDPDAQTIAIRQGFSSAQWRIYNDPWVIPIGAIEDSDVVEAAFLQKAYVRFVLRDLAGYCPLVTSDLGYVPPQDKDVKGLAGYVREPTSRTPQCFSGAGKAKDAGTAAALAARINMAR